MAEPVSPRFLDAHAWSGRLPDALGAGTLDDLASLGIQGGVAGAIASKLHDSRRGNQQLVGELLDRPGWRPCWTLIADASGAGTEAFGQVHEALRVGAAAVTLYPRTQDFSFRELTPAWKALESEQLPVIIDRSEVEWSDLDRLAREYPQLPIVVSWVGYRELRRLAPLLREHPNVLLDTVNFSTHRGFDWFVENFGAERLLFATGTPFRDPGEAITQLLWSGLTQEQIAMVSHGNAERVFGITADATRGPGDHLTPDPELGSLGSDVLARRPAARRIVDAHAHAGPYSLFHIPNPDPEHMVAVMDRCGVDVTVVSTNRAIQEDAHVGNDETLAAVDKFPHRIRGYGVVNPWQDPETELERIATDPRFVGIKIHPDLHRYPMTGARYRAVWEFSARTGCPVLTHTWYGSLFDTPRMIRDVAQLHGGITTLIGHSGTLPPGFEESVEVAEQVPGAHLEICGSFMTRASLRMMIERVGACRVVFGSDFPFIDQRVSLGRVAFSDLTPTELDAILAGNADRLFAWRDHSRTAVERHDHHVRAQPAGVTSRADHRSLRT